MAPKKAHASCRTVDDWVQWCESEGFSDITTQDPRGKVLPGKVFCKLCTMWLVANKKTIVRHCLGYKAKDKEGVEKHMDTEHMKKVQKREELKKQQMSAAVPAQQLPIIVQVCASLGTLWLHMSFFVGARCNTCRHRERGISPQTATR